MTVTTNNLLVELFVEELPPKALKKLGEAFAAKLFDVLQLNDFLEPDSSITGYASPRRLAAHISLVREISQPRALPPKAVMPAAIGLKDGQPTPALLKKLRSVFKYSETVDIEWLMRERIFIAQEGSKDVVMHRYDNAVGSNLNIALQAAIEDAIAALPIPKEMSYQLESGSGPDFRPGWTTVHFVRPAHGLVALHGDQVVPVSVLGLQAGRNTQGHRFEAAVNPVVLRHADSYAQQLADEGAVIASFADRRAEIVRQLAAVANRAGSGLQPIQDGALLDEVTALVERPNVLLCQFEPEFLAVPAECLILTMKANQKYFPLLDPAGKLTHQFAVVSNIRPADASAVICGNERVVRPRLADAKFFFDQDRKKTLASRVDGLHRVVYHGKMGSQGERALRVQAIAHAIVNQMRAATLPYTVEAKDQFEVLDSKAAQAALLAKTDLLTDMVGEFPELQGTMGGYYARFEGLRDGVAIAIEDHYKPRFAGDSLPRNHTGTVLALADKLETLVGLFGIGQLPTGDKDPFALRRQALGVLRILIEKNLPLELDALISAAEGVFAETHRNTPAAAPLKAFIADRLAVQLREQGFSAQEVDAVLALQPTRLGDVPKRLAAVRAFAALVEAAPLAAANKRVGNILKKSDTVGATPVNPALLVEPAEAALHAALASVAPQADAAFAAGDYTASLQALAALKTPVDAFFETVMVNANDAALRTNRLALLGTLHASMNRVADLARLVS